MNYKTVGILVLAVCLVSSVSGANYDFIKGRKDRISSHLELEDMKEHKECNGGEKCEPLHKLQNKAGVDYVCGDKSLYEYLTVDKIGDETFPSGICATKVANTFAAGGPDVFFDIGCACENQRLRSIMINVTAVQPVAGAAFVFCNGANSWKTRGAVHNLQFFCSTAN
eukprot:951696_1